MNVEVTVTGNRGWADEANKELAADMSVVGKIWFSPSLQENPILRQIWKHFNELGLKFPSDKANAIVVKTHKMGDPAQKVFPLTKGLTDRFPMPNFARHDGIAWSVGHLDVQIGAIEKTHVEKVDQFNQMVLDVFNTASGNMLKEGNVLSWNVWFTAPEVVNQREWANHAEKWRLSIDADHGSPEGPGTVARYFDGSEFKPLKELIIKELPKIVSFMKEHLIDEPAEA